MGEVTRIESERQHQLKESRKVAMIMTKTLLDARKEELGGAGRFSHLFFFLTFFHVVPSESESEPSFAFSSFYPIQLFSRLRLSWQRLSLGQGRSGKPLSCWPTTLLRGSSFPSGWRSRSQIYQSLCYKVMPTPSCGTSRRWSSSRQSLHLVSSKTTWTTRTTSSGSRSHWVRRSRSWLPTLPWRRYNNKKGRPKGSPAVGVNVLLKKLLKNKMNITSNINNKGPDSSKLLKT